MTDTKEIIRILGFIHEYFDNHADEQEPDCRKELFRDWSEITLDAITLLKAQEPRVMTLEEVRSRPCFGWIEERENIKTYIALFDFNEMSGLWPCAHVRDNRGNDTLLFFESYNKDWRCWTSKPTDVQRKNTPWIEGD